MSNEIFKPGELVLYVFSDQIRFIASILKVYVDGTYRISTESGNEVTVSGSYLQKIG